MKKIILFSVCLALVFSIFVIPINVTARYTYIRELSAGLTIDSMGIASSGGTVKAWNWDVNRADVSVSLQRQVGNSWVTIAGPWTASGTGFTGASASGRVAVARGHNYRARVTGNVRSSMGMLLESDTMYSGTRWF